MLYVFLIRNSKCHNTKPMSLKDMYSGRVKNSRSKSKVSLDNRILKVRRTGYPSMKRTCFGTISKRSVGRNKQSSRQDPCAYHRHECRSLESPDIANSGYPLLPLIFCFPQPFLPGRARARTARRAPCRYCRKEWRRLPVSVGILPGWNPGDPGDAHC